MAHRHRPFYNLDTAVGPAGGNKRDDVLLVQFLLRELATQPNTLLPWKKPAQPLEVNGTANQNLFDWIRSFQEAVKGYGSPVHVDGIVDPARGAISDRTTITHTFYTIMYLNNLFESDFPDLYPRLHLDLKVPRELRDALNNTR